MLTALATTWRVRRPDEDVLRSGMASGPVVFAFFHGQMVPLVALHRDLPVAGLASHSADGAMLAGIIQRLGYAVVRGSSSRGGAMAMRSMLRELAAGQSVALAVDGPRGPRRIPQMGALSLAAVSGRPVLYVVARIGAAWRLSSWDRTVLPLPGARVELRYGLFRVTSRRRTDLKVAARRLGEVMRQAAGDDGGEPYPRDEGS